MKRILVVGYFINHVVGSKVELCKRVGFQVHAADIANWDSIKEVYQPDSSHVFSHVEELRHRGGALGSWLREAREFARNLGFLRENAQARAFVNQVIAKTQPDIVWGVWGEGVLKWLRIFSRCGYRGHLIWTANVFPNGLTDGGRLQCSAEGVLYRHWLRRLHGVIVTNERMRDFIQTNYPFIERQRFLSMPDFMPASWYANEFKGPREPGHYHVVYLGSPERYGKQIDEVNQEIRSIGDRGVHVHLARPKDGILNHPFVHYYEPFPDSSFLNGKFGQFLNQFDAAIICYNYQRFHPRFASTYPTRMLVSLCGGIPLFVRSGALLACEEFVAEHQIGKVYTTTQELRNFLENDTLMESLRAKARHNRENFASDSRTNLERLREYLSSL